MIHWLVARLTNRERPWIDSRDLGAKRDPGPRNEPAGRICFFSLSKKPNPNHGVHVLSTSKCGPLGGVQAWHTTTPAQIRAEGRRKLEPVAPKIVVTRRKGKIVRRTVVTPE